MLRVLLGLALGLALGGHAMADEWRYCIAPAHAAHKIYITPVFAMSEATGNPEAAFAAVLAQSHIAYDDVQCPLSDSEATALAMQQHTAHFNEAGGNQIVNLRWRPKN